MELELRRGGLAARVDTLGAELVSCRREGGPEYIWTGDPAYWAGRNPLLFPVVGNLRDGKVRIGGREYAMARHGFARRREFVPEDRGEDWARLVLSADPDTLDVETPLVGGCRMKLRAGPGLVGGGKADKEVKFVLDGDFSTAGQLGADTVPEKLEQLHRYAVCFFRGAVTEELRQAMGPLDE